MGASEVHSVRGKIIQGRLKLNFIHFSRPFSSSSLGKKKNFVIANEKEKREMSKKFSFQKQSEEEKSARRISLTKAKMLDFSSSPRSVVFLFLLSFEAKKKRKEKRISPYEKNSKIHPWEKSHHTGKEGRHRHKASLTAKMERRWGKL
jgi:hydroxylamine reductase (hybrid-cluster protein)